MFRAHIRHEPLGRHVDIYLADEMPDGSLFVHGAGGDTVSHVEPRAEVGHIDPTLRLPEQALPALLAAISGHLGAVEHPQQLRRDYDAERARVDQALTALTALVLR